jgi:hypothetical protein
MKVFLKTRRCWVSYSQKKTGMVKKAEGREDAREN